MKDRPLFYALVAAGLVAAIVLVLPDKTNVRDGDEGGRSAAGTAHTSLPDGPERDDGNSAEFAPWTVSSTIKRLATHADAPSAPAFRLLERLSAPVVAEKLLPGEPVPSAINAVTSSTVVDPDSLGSLALLQVGDQVSFPMPEGGWISGHVNYRKTESETGRVAIAGDLAGRPGHEFSLFVKDDEVFATLLLPDEGRALLLQRAEDGRLLLQEKPVGSVICHGMPISSESALISSASPLESPAAAAPVSVPILDSRPEAAAVLYLDFDGETVTDPGWNGGKTIQAPPATLGGSPISSAQIEEVWGMVAEDFRSFHISVTTSASRYNTASVRRRMRCIVTPFRSWYSNTAGGVAYINAFSEAGSSRSSTVPCWAFNNATVRNMAITISHELGHTLGLSHDGGPGSTPSEKAYYAGHGTGATGWGPIMGAPWNKRLTQWSKGDYFSANQKEDDLALIARSANGFGYRADDVGNTLGTARTVAGNSLGTIDESGLLHNSADIDCFRFTTGGGTINVTCNPNPVEPNLNTALELRDSAGTLLAESSPDGVLTSSISRHLPVGEYFLMVKSIGEGSPLSNPPTGFTAYGSVGSYRLSGGFAPGGHSLSANPTIRTVPKTGGAFSFAVAATGNWSWIQSTGTSWLTSAEPASQSGNKTFGYSVAANTSGVPRTATISLAIGSLSATHTVIQADHGDSTATATVVGQNSTTAGSVESAGSNDFFRINIAVPGMFIVHTTGSTDTFGHLLDSSGNELATDDNGGEATNFRMVFPVEAGTYYVRVRHRLAGGTGSYQLVSSWGSHVWKTFAGMPGTSGITNGTGMSARFNVPVGLATDRNGNFYVGDGYNHTVRKVNPAGVVTTVAGSAGIAGSTNGAGGSARFNRPYGVATDAAGNLYVADYLNHTIRKVTPGGVVTTLAGSPGSAGSANGTGTAARFNGPCGIAVDVAGNLYVTELQNHTVRRVTPSGTVTTVAGRAGTAGNANGTGSAARFNQPWGVAADGSGNLYVTEIGNHAIRKISPDGFVSTVVGSVTTAGNVDGLGSTARFRSPRGIATTAYGELYVADTGNHSIRRITPDGQVTTIGGSGSSGNSDGLGSGARFNHPYMVLPTSDGSVYVVDGNHRISRGQPDDAPPISNSVVAWGDNSHGQSEIPSGLRPISLAGGWVHSVALQADGMVVAWGSNIGGKATVPATLGASVSVAAGAWHTAAVRANGTVLAWGDNPDGQTTVPSGLTGVASVAAGFEHTVALRGNGTVAAWGSNEYGQRTVPTGLSGVIAISAGNYHTVALKNNGTVVTWGDDSYGQRTVPPGLSGVVAIAAGGEHTVALKSDGTVVAWGNNFHGQRTVPPGLNGVVAIAAGWGHTSALKNDGTVVVWGDSSLGQASVPQGLGGVSAIATGFNHNFALVADLGLSVAPASREVEAEGGSFDFDVSSAGSWDWVPSGNSSWLSSSEPSRQHGDQIFSYTVEPNNSTSPRTATITVARRGIIVTHTINQAGRPVVDDHGNTISNASPVAPNSTTSGKLETAGDNDYFRINVTGAGTLTINTTGTTDTYGHLLDASGNELAVDDDGGESWNFRIVRAVSAGTYYVRVRHWSSGGVGDYSLVSSFATGASLSATPTTRNVVSEGGAFSFNVGGTGSWSWSMSANSGWISSGEPGNQSGNQVFSYSVAANPGQASRTATITLTGGAGSATHTIVQAGTTTGGGGGITSAIRAGLNDTMTGNIASAGENNYYRFDVYTPGILTISTAGGTDTVGHFLDGLGNEVDSDDDNGGDGNFRIVRHVAAGLYFVRVRHYSPGGTGAYQLVSSFSPDTPLGSVAPPTGVWARALSKTRILVSWKRHPSHGDNVVYIVHKKEPRIPWVYYTDYRKTTKRTSTRLKQNTRYAYRVYAFDRSTGMSSGPSRTVYARTRR